MRDEWLTLMVQLELTRGGAARALREARDLALRELLRDMG